MASEQRMDDAPTENLIGEEITIKEEWEDNELIKQDPFKMEESEKICTNPHISARPCWDVDISNNTIKNEIKEERNNDYPVSETSGAVPNLGISQNVMPTFAIVLPPFSLVQCMDGAQPQNCPQIPRRKGKGKNAPQKYPPTLTEKLMALKSQLYGEENALESEDSSSSELGSVLPSTSAGPVPLIKGFMPSTAKPNQQTTNTDLNQVKEKNPSQKYPPTLSEKLKAIKTQLYGEESIIESDDSSSSELGTIPLPTSARPWKKRILSSNEITDKNVNQKKVKKKNPSQRSRSKLIPIKSSLLGEGNVGVLQMPSSDSSSSELGSINPSTSTGPQSFRDGSLFASEDTPKEGNLSTNKPNETGSEPSNQEKAEEKESYPPPCTLTSKLVAIKTQLFGQENVRDNGDSSCDLASILPSTATGPLALLNDRVFTSAETLREYIQSYPKTAFINLDIPLERKNRKLIIRVVTNRVLSHGVVPPTFVKMKIATQLSEILKLPVRCLYNKRTTRGFFGQCLEFGRKKVPLKTMKDYGVILENSKSIMEMEQQVESQFSLMERKSAESEMSEKSSSARSTMTGHLTILEDPAFISEDTLKRYINTHPKTAKIHLDMPIESKNRKLIIRTVTNRLLKHGARPPLFVKLEIAAQLSKILRLPLETIYNKKNHRGFFGQCIEFARYKLRQNGKKGGEGDSKTADSLIEEQSPDGVMLSPCRENPVQLEEPEQILCQPTVFDEEDEHMDGIYDSSDSGELGSSNQYVYTGPMSLMNDPVFTSEDSLRQYLRSHPKSCKINLDMPIDSKSRKLIIRTVSHRVLNHGVSPHVSAKLKIASQLSGILNLPVETIYNKKNHRGFFGQCLEFAKHKFVPKEKINTILPKRTRSAIVKLEPEDDTLRSLIEDDPFELETSEKISTNEASSDNFIKKEVNPHSFEEENINEYPSYEPDEDSFNMDMSENISMESEAFDEDSFHDAGNSSTSEHVASPGNRSLLKDPVFNSEQSLKEFINTHPKTCKINLDLPVARNSRKTILRIVATRLLSHSIKPPVFFKIKVAVHLSKILRLPFKCLYDTKSNRGFFGQCIEFARKKRLAKAKEDGVVPPHTTDPKARQYPIEDRLLSLMEEDRCRLELAQKISSQADAYEEENLLNRGSTSYKNVPRVQIMSDGHRALLEDPTFDSEDTLRNYINEHPKTAKIDLDRPIDSKSRKAIVRIVTKRVLTHGISPPIPVKFRIATQISKIVNLPVESIYNIKTSRGFFGQCIEFARQKMLREARRKGIVVQRAKKKKYNYVCSGATCQLCNGMSKEDMLVEMHKLKTVATDQELDLSEVYRKTFCHRRSLLEESFSSQVQKVPAYGVNAKIVIHDFEVLHGKGVGDALVSEFPDLQKKILVFCRSPFGVEFLNFIQGLEAMDELNRSMRILMVILAYVPQYGKNGLPLAECLNSVITIAPANSNIVEEVSKKDLKFPQLIAQESDGKFSFSIVFDGIMSKAGNTFAESLDILFKYFCVFNITYPRPLKFFYEFLQFYFYKIKYHSESPSPRVLELMHRLSQ